MFSAIMYIAYSMKITQNGERLIVRCVVKKPFKAEGHIFTCKQIHMHTERAIYLLTSTPFYGIMDATFP